MCNKWSSIESLVIWLFDHYSVARQAVIRGSEPSAYLGENKVDRKVLTLRLIFSRPMLKALFIWGFRNAGKNLTFKRSDKLGTLCEPWARGLWLLRQIQRRQLFDATSEARTAFQQQLWTILGLGHSSRGANIMARRQNSISLAHYINHANEVWPGLIDWVESELLDEHGPSDPQLLVQFFGSYYRTKRKTMEYANVQEWADALVNVNKSQYMQPTSSLARMRAWRRSRFRVLFHPTRSPHVEDAELLSSARQATEAPSSAVNIPDLKYHPFRVRQSPSARSKSWHPPPSPRYIPAPP